MRGRVVWGIAVLGATALIVATLGAGLALAGGRTPRRALPSAIGAKTGGVRAVTEGSVTVMGTVVPSGRTEYYFAFGKTRAYGARTPWTLVRSRRQRVHAAAEIAGLTPARTYHYRLMAAGCAHCRAASGADRVFTTAAVPAPPGVETGAANAIEQTTATPTGSVNPKGRATSYYFSYGPTEAYGLQTPVRHAGARRAAGAATSPLSGLSAVTTYHYRLVATSKAGTTYGADETFTTGGYYQNPVYSAASMPDPFVLDNGDKHSDYWAFGTGVRFPVLHSTDLVHWTAEGTAMTTRPSWVVGSGDWHPWAPSVIESDQSCPGTTSGGCYVMYYVGLGAQFNVNCIGVATSPTPGGPYSDQGPLAVADSLGDAGPPATGMPVGCGDDAGEGNIDPSPFIDSSGQAYLYVSTDRSCSTASCVLQPTISVIPLASDLLQASGARVALFSGAGGTWEAAGVQAPTVEGPFTELHDGTYYLFYSGGSWQAAYGMGYATATSPTGPFTKSPTNPIFIQTSTVFGPGGGDDLVTGPHGGLWLLYAARASTANAPRTLWLDPFDWRPAPTAGAPDVPVISGPTSTLQPTQP
jgi:hypothetical protein